jgi:hypothetical protein
MHVNETIKQRIFSSFQSRKVADLFQNIESFRIRSKTENNYLTEKLFIAPSGTPDAVFHTTKIKAFARRRYDKIYQQPSEDH